MFRFFASLFLLSLSLTVVACGGGGEEVFNATSSTNISAPHDDAIEAEHTDDVDRGEHEAGESNAD